MIYWDTIYNFSLTWKKNQFVRTLNKVIEFNLKLSFSHSIRFHKIGLKSSLIRSSAHGLFSLSIGQWCETLFYSPYFSPLCAHYYENIFYAVMCYRDIFSNEHNYVFWITFCEDQNDTKHDIAVLIIRNIPNWS